MTEAPVQLALDNLSRYFQSGDSTVKALDNVSLTIRRGEFVAIMGASGSGKSTLMNIIGCLDRASAGTYRVLGRDVTRLNAQDLAALRRNSFGFIFQRYHLLATATANENVVVPAVYAGMSGVARKKRARELLQRLGMGERIDYRPHQLSGGQQQRVAIARALMNNPPIILADEPTGALDSKSGAEVMSLLLQLHREGRTIILITHEEDLALQAQRIIRLQDGHIVEDKQITQPPSDLIESSQLEQSSSSSQSFNIGFMPEMVESVKSAFRALRVNLFRTALTLLGIIIGVAAVVTMLAVGNGSKQKVLSQISAMGTNLLSIRPGRAGFRGGGDIVTLVPDDAVAIGEIPNIEIVVPERSSQIMLRYGNIDYATTVQGVGPGLPFVNDWPAMAGSFFSKRDVESRAPVAVLGRTVVSTLFANGENPVGRYILIRNIPFEVIGVMSVKGATPWGRDQDDVVFVPITTGLTRLFGENHLNGITVRIADLKRMDETEAEISQLLLQRHGSEDFRIRNTASLLETVSQTQNTLTVLLGTVAAISLLVGGIGVMNIMLVSVTERTREIGIRMATGARRKDILIQFVTEAAVVCFAGGLLGLLTGVISGWIISLFDVAVVFSAAPALLAFSCAVLTGLVFGWLPAQKAANLDPVVALSSE